LRRRRIASVPVVGLSAASFAAISSTAAVGSAYASEPPSQCPSGLGARSAPAPESEPSAQADAAATLAEVPLPPGSSESSTDPAEAGSLLAGPAFGPPTTPNAVDEHAWWLVPVPPAETLVYICTHLPPDTTRPTTFGGGLMGPNVPENMIAAFTWPGGPARWLCGWCGGRTDQRRCGWTRRSYGSSPAPPPRGSRPARVCSRSAFTRQAERSFGSSPIDRHS
jgi:hypothetical protein